MWIFQIKKNTSSWSGGARVFFTSPGGESDWKNYIYIKGKVSGLFLSTSLTAVRSEPLSDNVCLPECYDWKHPCYWRCNILLLMYSFWLIYVRDTVLKYFSTYSIFYVFKLSAISGFPWFSLRNSVFMVIHNFGVNMSPTCITHKSVTLRYGN